MVAQHISSRNPASLFKTSSNMATSATNGLVVIDEKHVTPALSCKYPSKKCWNPRVQKRNGDLHKFCEYHRQKANENQRRMEQRRKLEKQQQDKQSKPSFFGGFFSTTNKPAVHQHVNTLMVTHLAPIQMPEPYHNTKQEDPLSSSKLFESDIAGDENDSEDVDMDVDDITIKSMSIELSMEPSNQPVELLEEDLFYYDHFIQEIANNNSSSNLTTTSLYF